MPINLDLVSLCQLKWHQDPYSPMLVLLYASAGSTTLDAELVIKRNLLSGQYTDVFFDHQATPLTNVFFEEAPARLIFGSLSSLAESFHGGIEVRGDVTQPVIVRRLSATAEVLAPVKKGWSSGDLTQRYLNLVRWLWVDISCEAQVDVTLETEGQPRSLQPIMPTGGDRICQRISVPGSTKGTHFKVSLASTGFFRLYDERVRIDVKPVGQRMGYQSVALQGENPQS